MIGLKDLREMPAWFRGTKAGREMVDELQGEIDAQRRHHAEVVKTHERAAAETLPKLATATAAARDNLAAAKQHVAECQRALVVCEVAELSEQNRLNGALAQSRAFLQDTAPDCVVNYLGELLEFYGDIRRAGIEQPDVFPNADMPNVTLIEQQRQQLNERWEHTLVVREFHELVRSTITLVKQLHSQPLTAEQAAAEIESHRRCLANAQKKAGIILERQ